MRTIILPALVVMAISQTAHGMGHKRMNLAEVKGVSETQVVRAPEGQKLSIMVRGKAAELLFNSLKAKKQEKIGSDALELIGNMNTNHWHVKGRQVACSRIHNQKTKKEDFACAFELNEKGQVAANIEPFSPSVFNLARTQTKAGVFPQNRKGRGLASVASPHPVATYAMYDNPNKATQAKPEFEDTMIIFRGESARNIMGFLTEGNGAKPFYVSNTKGMKGREISCVEARASEPARCALVVSLNDGSISTRKNPLFK